MNMETEFSLDGVKVGLVNRVTGSVQVESLTLIATIYPDGALILRLLDPTHDAVTNLVSFTVPPQLVLAMTAVIPCAMSLSKFEDGSAFEKGDGEDDE